MKKIFVALLCVIGLFGVYTVATAQYAFFLQNHDSEMAFLRSEAYIGARVGESVELMLPYITESGQKDPMLELIRGPSGGREEEAPTFSMGAAPLTVTPVEAARAGSSGRFQLNMLTLRVTAREAGIYYADRLRWESAQGEGDMYPIGSWTFEVLAPSAKADLEVDEGFEPVSAQANAYLLPVRNASDAVLWISGVRLRERNAVHSMTLSPGEGIEFAFGEADLTQTFHKSILRIVRPIVTYTREGAMRAFMPPVAHLGYSNIDYNALVQEMDQSKTARAIMRMENQAEAQPVNLGADRDLCLKAARVSGLSVDDFLAALRDRRMRPADVRSWLDSPFLTGFRFVYEDDTDMTAKDARLVWGLKMAAYLDSYGYLDAMDEDAFPPEWLGDWLLESAAWQIQDRRDMRGHQIPDATLTALGRLRDARLETIGAGREILAQKPQASPAGETPGRGGR